MDNGTGMTALRLIWSFFAFMYLYRSFSSTLEVSVFLGLVLIMYLTELF